MRREYTIIDEAGLHARPASLIVAEVSRHADEAYIIYNSKRLQMKSILLVMSLGIPFGEEFSVEIIGNNDEVIISNIETILNENKVI